MFARSAGRLAPLALVGGIALFPGCLQGPAAPEATAVPKAAASGSKSPTPGPGATATPTGTPTSGPGAALKAKTAGLIVTAIEFNANDDVVAVLKNIEAAPIDLNAQKYQLCTNFIYGKLSKTRTAVAAGAAVRVHLQLVSGCVESDTEFCPDYTDSGGPPTGANALKATRGNLSIYKGIGTFADFGTAAKLVDFVEWGDKGDQPREDVAVDAGLWKAGTFVPVTAQASISVKAVGNSGVDNWQ